VVIEHPQRPAGRGVPRGGDELDTAARRRRSAALLPPLPEQGLPEWTINDVQAPARHRLYRAVAAELSVLKPGSVDVRIPVNAESFAAH
jgi:hypothetical protein